MAKDLVALLDGIEARQPTRRKAVDRLDDDTKAAVLAAFDRGVSAREIADTLTEAGCPISANPIMNFVRSQRQH